MEAAQIRQWLKTKTQEQLEQYMNMLNHSIQVQTDLMGPNHPATMQLHEEINLVADEMIYRLNNIPNIQATPSFNHLLSLGNGTIDDERNFILKPKKQIYIPATFYEFMARS